MDIDQDSTEQFDDIEDEVAAVASPGKVEDDLPEKYRGKSASEIAKMHQEAEKLISRQGQEVSEVRRLADQLIQRSFQTQPQPAGKPDQDTQLDDVDFFADPKAAVSRAVENHPSVKQAREMALSLGRQEAVRQMQGKHPDFREILGDDDFKGWVQGSKVRQQLFLAADQRYDTDAADELFSTYKALRGARSAETKEKVDGLKDAQQASLRAAGNPAVGGSSEPTGKKIYRRADLIDLQIRNPSKYETLQNEIMQAYSEGRVR